MVCKFCWVRSGRSGRDRGAELLDGRLTHAAGTRTAGKDDLDIGYPDPAQNLAKIATRLVVAFDR